MPQLHRQAASDTCVSAVFSMGHRGALALPALDDFRVHVPRRILTATDRMHMRVISAMRSEARGGDEAVPPPAAVPEFLCFAEKDASDESS